MYRLALLILGAAVLAACAGGQTLIAEPQVITLKAVDISYEPKTIEVLAGQRVQLRLVNEGTLEHDFNITEIAVTGVHDSNEGGHAGHDSANSDLHTSAEPGGSSTLAFTATEPGTYEFFCTVSGHKEAGAVGMLIVK